MLDERWAVPLDLGITMDGLIRDWATASPGLSEAAAGRRGEGLAIGDLEWLPPIPRPGKVIGVALNNSANVDRIMSGPKSPATFIKPASSLIGNGQPIRLRPQYGRVHPEPELPVVIGQGGSGIPAADAYQHVFGYPILNDLTSPTMRAEDTFHYRAIHPRPGIGTLSNPVERS
jgi:2-keto-4-pentenoate hydratase/2-oxohepta-3-ene-1,7-dioic acid hydratase in catechol pathway